MFDEEEVVGDQALTDMEPPTPPAEEAEELEASDDEFLNAKPNQANNKQKQLNQVKQPPNKEPFIGNGIGSGQYQALKKSVTDALARKVEVEKKKAEDASQQKLAQVKAA